jgi:LysM repeat protein
MNSGTFRSSIPSAIAFVVVVALLTLAFVAGATAILARQVNTRPKESFASSTSFAGDTQVCATVSCTTYTVSSGDSLFTIGQKYNVSASEIAAVNGIQPPYYIYVGETLLIPLASTTNSTTTTTSG